MPVPAIPRKLFCLPVFTSLFFVIALTGLVLYQLSKSIHIPKVYRIFLPTDEKDSPYTIRYNGNYLASQLRGKKVITIQLMGDRHDAGKLEFIRQESLRIQYTNDTMQVIRVHFSARSTYGQFLCMMQITEENNHKHYAFWKDDFYFFANPPGTEPDSRTSSTSFSCGI